MNDSLLALSSFYDHTLVALSVLIAILASHAALELAKQVTSAQRTARFFWLAGGATAMGFGIWSMHYIGMLAFRLPVQVQYDWPTVLLSLLAAILASAIALFVVSREKMGWAQALLGSIFMGGGIAAMHYIGMAAMRLPAMCRWSAPLVTLSVVLAVVISLVALWLTFYFRTDNRLWSWRKGISALVMGAAIPVMHYTGMAAATFMPSPATYSDLSHAVSVSSLSVAGISIVTFMVLGLVLLTSIGNDSLANTRHLTARYFASLGAISLLVILSTLVVQYQGHQSQSDTRMVNIAGRQRMLSQTITKDVLLLARTTDDRERRRLTEDLRNISDVWEQAHLGLQRGDSWLGVPGTNSPEVRQMFADLEPHYKAMISTVRELVARESTQEVADMSAEVKVILAEEGKYLRTMNDIVFQYDHEEKLGDDRKSQLHFGLLLFILAALLLQGLVVLRPALARIQSGISQLESAQDALRRKATFVELLQVVAVAANEATSVEAALQFTLDRICEHTGWPVGHVYFCGSKTNNQVVSSSLWHLENAAQFKVFRQATSNTPLEIGSGLPGRVVETGKALWIPDINEDNNFPRKKAALDLGVRGAFGFPVHAQGEVVAVLEFFSSKIEQPDSELLVVMANVGAQLGQLVARTRAQEELSRKAHELARSNAELEQFAYVASHDLQEPLRMVASYTQLLARRYRGKLDADADEFIGFAVDGATRMQGLIRDLLSLSRVTTQGKEMQVTDSQKVCNQAVTNLRAAITDCGAKVTVDSLPPVLADATQLTQLFQNLIGNAIKYRNSRKPEVHVAATPVDGHWVFSVHDNGIGIEPEYFERIFQLFQRLHTSKEYSGTGIGLALCRKIIERHGGKIWVESRLGEGSTFLFTLQQTERTQA